MASGATPQESRGILNFVLPPNENDNNKLWSNFNYDNLTNTSDGVVQQNTCSDLIVPTAIEYLKALNTGGYILLGLAIFSVILIFILYIDVIRHVVTKIPSKLKSPTVAVLTIYPIVALSTLCASIVPRSQLLSEAISQLTFTGAWYQFFCLLIAYCGGESALVVTRPDVLSPRVPPLCCFWCCMPATASINKTNLRRIRFAVIQLPVIQTLLYITMLVAWAETQDLDAGGLTIYLLPIMSMSIFTGLWGVIMMVRMLAPRVLAEYSIVQKMVVLQLVLIFSKVQVLIIKAIYFGNGFPCSPPISPEVFGNLIYNSLTMIEVVVLQLFAWRLYKMPLPKAPNSILKKVVSIEDGDGISDIVQIDNRPK